MLPILRALMALQLTLGLTLAHANDCENQLRLKQSHYLRPTNEVPVEAPSVADLSARVSRGDEFELIPMLPSLSLSQTEELVNLIYQLSRGRVSPELHLIPNDQGEFIVAHSGAKLPTLLQQIVDKRVEEVHKRLSKEDFYVAFGDLVIQGDGVEPVFVPDEQLHIDTMVNGYVWAEALQNEGTIGLGVGHFFQTPVHMALLFRGSPEAQFMVEHLAHGFMHGKPVVKGIRVFLRLQIERP